MIKTSESIGLQREKDVAGRIDAEFNDRKVLKKLLKPRPRTIWKTTFSFMEKSIIYIHISSNDDNDLLLIYITFSPRPSMPFYIYYFPLTAFMWSIYPDFMHMGSWKLEFPFLWVSSCSQNSWFWSTSSPAKYSKKQNFFSSDGSCRSHL